MNFKYNLDQDKQGLIIIRDLFGRTTNEIRFTGGNTEILIDVSRLISGIYILEVNINGKVVQRTKEIILK